MATTTTMKVECDKCAKVIIDGPLGLGRPMLAHGLSVAHTVNRFDKATGLAKYAYRTRLELCADCVVPLREALEKVLLSIPGTPKIPEGEWFGIQLIGPVKP